VPVAFGLNPIPTRYTNSVYPARARIPSTIAPKNEVPKNILNDRKNHRGDSKNASPPVKSALKNVSMKPANSDAMERRRVGFRARMMRAAAHTGKEKNTMNPAKTMTAGRPDTARSTSYSVSVTPKGIGRGKAKVTSVSKSAARHKFGQSRDYSLTAPVMPET
jgi:hypothetical protein